MLYVETDRYVGRSLERYGEFSPGELDLLARYVKPGDTVLDVGAYVGTHTVAFARCVGPAGAVLAFEPQPAAYAILCRNVARNALPQVDARQAAVARPGTRWSVPALDYTREDNFAGLSLHAWEDEAGMQAVAIDDLPLSRCDLVKVDVEGMEADVLASGARTLRTRRPILYVENDREERSSALIRLLLDLGYRLYWHLVPLYRPNNWRDEGENLFPGIVSANMLGIPEEQPQPLLELRRVESAQETWRTAVALR